MPLIDISRVAERSGLPASTLRYYESQGLIRSVGRHGLRRLFEPGVLDRLALITLGRAAGLTLAQIAPMLGSDGHPQIDRSVLAKRADQLDADIRRLRAIRDSLRHAAACPAPSHLECPSFRRLLGAAAVVEERPRVKRAAPRRR